MWLVPSDLLSKTVMDALWWLKLPDPATFIYIVKMQSPVTGWLIYVLINKISNCILANKSTCIYDFVVDYFIPNMYPAWVRPLGRSSSSSLTFDAEVSLTPGLSCSWISIPALHKLCWSYLVSQRVSSNLPLKLEKYFLHMLNLETHVFSLADCFETRNFPFLIKLLYKVNLIAVTWNVIKIIQVMW